MRHALLCSLLAITLAEAGTTDDVALLLDGVKASRLGLAGPIVLVGPEACALLAGGDGKSQEVVAAASRLGQGRVVAFGHNSALANDSFLTTSDTGRLVLNALRWTAGGKDPAVVGVRGSKGIQRLLTTAKIPFRILEKNWLAELPAITVLVAENGDFTDAAATAATQAFLAKGGGLITAGTAWGWAQGHQDQTIRDDFPLNRLLKPAGLAFGDGTVDSPEAGFPPASHPLLHAVKALDVLAGGQAADRAQAAAAVLGAVRTLMADDTFLLPQLSKLAAGRPATFPTEKVPFTAAKHGLDRILAAVEDERWHRLTPATMVAAPAAADFPGAVPADAARVERTVTIDTAIPDWHSTGLYAPPGAAITVTVPAAAVGRKFAVRIGAHTDHLWDKDRWSRSPALSWSIAITHAVTQIANPYGGAVYIIVPRKQAAERLAVRIAGAVEAPLFVLGTTTPAQWAALRQAPGPWAELVTPRIILSVPSSVVRALDDPTAVLTFWDEVVVHEDRLAGWKPEDRQRPERFVCDRQISAGYMHSGYPIMAHLDVIATNFDLAKLKGTPAKPEGWGHWHELGHNHQDGRWTPGNQGEVTVNLFSLAVQMQLIGASIDHCWHGSMTPAKRAKAIAAYQADTTKHPGNWDPATGLNFYWQLIDGFGFEVLGRVLASYRSDPPTGELRTDAQKWDEWLRRYSREAKRDLGGFFKAWRIPVADATLAEAARQGAAWMHAAMAPKS